MITPMTSKERAGRAARGLATAIAVLMLAGLAIAPTHVIAVQGTLGKLTGIVTARQDGARLPGVSVTVTNEDIGSKNRTLTNDKGEFSFLLQPGKNYTIQAELDGFQTVKAVKVPIKMGDTTPLDIRMELGTLNDTITVNVDKNQLLKELSSSVGIVLDEQQIGGLPLYGNDPLTLIATLPGYRANPQGQPYDNPQFAKLYDGPNRPPQQPNTEAYDKLVDNPFITVKESPLATFSSDVDTASYSNIRRFLSRSQMPPRDAVRIEEMINYFSYDYPKVTGTQPISASIEAAAAPWNPSHRLVRIGIRAKDVMMGQKPSNLVFLIDVSGSMADETKLPLLKNSLRMLVERLTESDRVTIVTYAGSTGVTLPPTHGDRKDAILRAIDALGAGGSTNGGAGIQLAYDNAVKTFIEGGVNRVILATDGDFNVGITDRNDLLRLIEEKAKSGVFLTALGFGMGNYKDATLETLADKGNGNYAYIDSIKEAKKVMVDGLTGTLVTVAKDVKLQVEFNPSAVASYRLIGYENRIMQHQDFNNDRKDAGDMGAGHTVTALFEVVPPGVNDSNSSPFGNLRYQPTAKTAPARSSSSTSKELLNLKIRYKEPAEGESKLIEFPLVDVGKEFGKASTDFRFASAVASFGMILRGSPYRGSASMENVLRLAKDNKGDDKAGYRDEFVQLVQQAIKIGVR